MEVGEGDDAVDDAEAGVVEQVELAVRGERVRYLPRQNFRVDLACTGFSGFYYRVTLVVAHLG